MRTRSWGGTDSVYSPHPPSPTPLPLPLLPLRLTIGQTEYAAAFFLLADSLKDAVNVCFDRMNDIQLAIAVARVYEGDNGPVLRGLLQDRILPLAVEKGNRWLATWAFWMLRRKDMAVRCLLVCLSSCFLHITSLKITSDNNNSHHYGP